MRTIKELWRKYNESYHALYLVLGTSRFFLIADFGFMFDVVIDPQFTKRKLAKVPSYVWGIIAVIAISSIRSPEWFQGETTAIRILILALILPTYKYGYKYKEFLGVVLLFLALLVMAQSAVMVRSVGIHSTPSILGQTALVFAPIFWLQISAAVILIITFSIARSPLAALMIFAAITRKRYFIILAIIAAVLFIFYAAISTPDRINFSGVESAVNDRFGTFEGYSEGTLNDRYGDRICGDFREAEFLIWGYGWNGFCKSTGQPRPHNIYLLSLYELGILAVPFWGFILFGSWKFGIWKLFPLFALGLVTEELLGRPEGIYLIAIWIISIGLIGSPDENVERTLEKFG